MVNDKPIEVGDSVEVYINSRGDVEVVEVTALHSGYYDYAYTGVTPGLKKTVYFDWVQGWFVGRVV